MAYITTFPQHLVIDGVPMNTPAWEHLNLYTLYSGASVRGENRIMPGTPGVMALRRRPTETNRTISLAVFGTHSWDGTVNADPMQGLAENIDHLLTNVVDPMATTNSVRTAQIVGNGPILVASIQVLGFEIESDAISPSAVYASMDIAVIEGAFR